MVEPLSVRNVRVLAEEADRTKKPEAEDALIDYLTAAAVLELVAIVEAARANEDALVEYHRARTDRRGIDDALDRLRVARFTLRLALRKVAP